MLNLENNMVQSEKKDSLFVNNPRFNNSQVMMDHMYISEWDKKKKELSSNSNQKRQDALKEYINRMHEVNNQNRQWPQLYDQNMAEIIRQEEIKRRKNDAYFLQIPSHQLGGGIQEKGLATRQGASVRSHNNEWKNSFSPDYTVQSGDTLWGIAQKLGIPFQELVALNPQIYNINKINPGDGINYSQLPADDETSYWDNYGYSPFNKEDLEAMKLREKVLSGSGWTIPTYPNGAYEGYVIPGMSFVEDPSKFRYAPETKPAKKKNGGRF